MSKGVIIVVGLAAVAGLAYLYLSQGANIPGNKNKFSGGSKASFGGDPNASAYGSGSENQDKKIADDAIKFGSGIVSALGGILGKGSSSSSGSTGNFGGGSGQAPADDATLNSETDTLFGKYSDSGGGMN